tara:strand:+ start:7379 stop:7738 length:360 start_codon:yes stop_codon:yes gene_type:complete
MNRVLVIEDDEDLRACICEELRNLGNVVEEAGNGKEGLEALSKTTFDLVISDCQMPVMSGVEFLKIAKTLYPDLKVIILTGYSPFTKNQILNDFKADGFFEKPVQDLSLLLSYLPKKTA